MKSLKVCLAASAVAVCLGLGPALSDAAFAESSFSGPTIPAKAPAHLRVTVITCYSILHGCVAPADAVREAAQSLGWSVTVLDGGGTPAKQNAAMLDAISSGADVIANIAIDPKLVQLGLNEAKKAGVLVVSGSNGIDTPNPPAVPAPGTLGYAFDVAPDYAALGRATAAWIIKDSNGQGNVTVFSDRTFPSVIAVQIGLLAELGQCKGCVVSAPQYFTPTQVGTTLGPQTVGFIRNYPDSNYLFSPYDPAAADQVTALAQAGMGTAVKVIGVLGNQQNLAFIRAAHVQIADAAYDNQYMGYAIVDQIIRLKDGMPLFKPHGEDLPFAVLDKANLPAPGADWHAVCDYRSMYRSLWK